MPSFSKNEAKNDSLREFLANEETLAKWSPYSLRERVHVLRREKPFANISHSKLYRIYKEEGIKYKKRRWSKVQAELGREEVQHRGQELYSNIEHERSAGRKIIFVDETCFSKYTL